MQPIENIINVTIEQFIDAWTGECPALTESKLNHLVYHLYGLTYDEVLIIDSTPPFTREEHETQELKNL